MDGKIYARLLLVLVFGLYLQLSQAAMAEFQLGDSASSIFKSIPMLMCHGQTFPLQCPSGSQIIIPTAILGPMDALSTKIQALNMSACDASQNTPLASVSAVLSQCLNLKDVTSPIKQLCEGKLSCSISPDQFTANESSCAYIRRHLFLKYICEPSPQAIKNEIVCLDTYMELKCGGRHPKDVIAVLQATLEADTHSDRCPALPEMSQTSTLCPASIDVTPHLRGLCDRQRTCSVMPDPSMLPTNQPAICGKRHLRLTYACANPKIFENDTPAPADSPRRTKHRQGQKKKPRREELAVPAINRHTSPYESKPQYPATFQNMRSDNVPSLDVPELERPVLLSPHDLRDGVLSHSRQDEFENDYEWPKATTKTMPTPTLRNSGKEEESPSLHSIVLGVIVGLTVLIILLIVLVLIGFHNRRRKMINFGPRIPSGNLAISPSKNRLSVSTSRHSFSDTHVPMSLVETIDRSSSKQDSTGSNYVYLQQQAEQHMAYKCPMQHMSANTVFPSYAPQAQLSDIVWPLDQMPSTEHLHGYGENYQGDIPYELNASHPDGFVAKSGALFYKCPLTDAGSQAYAQLSYYHANDGKFAPKYARNTPLGKNSSGTRSSSSTNRSVNEGNVFPASRPCAVTELLSSQTRTGNTAAYGYNLTHCTSMEANSAFSGNGSIESDRFSGPVSSHPSSSPLASLNTVRPPNNPSCPQKSPPVHPKMEQCVMMSLSAENPFPAQQWIGFDNSTNYPGLPVQDAKVKLHLPSSKALTKTKSKNINGSTVETNHSNESLNTCLIEPPESFKNDIQPKGEDLESTPPQMPPLKLQVACEKLMSDGRPAGISSCWNEVSACNNHATGIT